MRLILTLFLFFIFGFPRPAEAALDFEDHAFPEFVTSARALAMGNAYICKVDDAWSSFYNPAGLGTVRQPRLHLANAHLEASTGMTQAVGGEAAYKIPGKYMDSFDADKMRAMLVKHEGKLAHSRINFFPNLTVRGFTMGYLFSQRNRAIINNDVANKYEIAERRDHGPVFSLSLPLFGGILKFGGTAAYVFRRDLYQSFDPNQNASIDSSMYKTGRGLQITAGGRLTIPWALLPTFAAVLRNATNNAWEGIDKNNAGAPDKIKQTVDVGFSITPQISKTSRIHMEVNLKDLNNAYDTDIKRRSAAGIEIDFNRRLFLRAGYGDGWGSGGLGVQSKTFTLDLTTYAIDRSQTGFRKEEDRRWVISLSSGF